MVTQVTFTPYRRRSADPTGGIADALLYLLRIREEAGRSGSRHGLVDSSFCSHLEMV
jgi:hypothetical protein